MRARSPLALPEDPTELLRDGVSRILTFLAPRAGAVVADLFATIGTLFAMLFALFFLMRDGDVIGRELRSLLPLPPAQSERVIRGTRDLVIASVGAGILVAIAQGTIGGVAFWLLGLGAPAFWGVVMAFCSLIPVVGAALVWVPAALWLLLSGSIGKGIAMVVIGALGISMADNVLRPLLLSGSTQVNGLIIFFGLLGGVAAFGFIGLVLGPVILVVTGNLLRMFARPDLVDTSADLELLSGYACGRRGSWARADSADRPAAGRPPEQAPLPAGRSRAPSSCGRRGSRWPRHRCAASIPRARPRRRARARVNTSGFLPA